MGRKSRLSIVRTTVLDYFQHLPRTVFRLADLTGILEENRETWRLAAATTTNRFAQFLMDEGELREVTLQSEHYLNAKVHRYTWGEPSPYELALSLKKSAYLCHATAVFLHGLTDLMPKTIFVNLEQSQKPPPSGNLSPTSLKAAFSRKQRQSKLSYRYNEWTFAIISGKNTNGLGVITLQGPTGEELRTTDIERTLIDIVVRPSYAGGIFKVIEAYQTAREKVSVERLARILQELNYIYPYHQAIGFLMERAGYSSHQYAKLKNEKDGFPLEHDFYLTHGMIRPEYDSSWRLFYPTGF